jgi:hypothetical protein
LCFRTLIDPDAPGPEYGGVLTFGSFASGSDVEAEPGVMYFVFGQAFLGYWAAADGRIVWFGRLPHVGPLTAARCRRTRGSCPTVGLRR